MTPDDEATDRLEQLTRERDRLARRHRRERAARLEAETVGERATRQLYDTVVELTDAEACAQVISEVAASVFGGSVDVAATLETIAASARRALRADRATCCVASADRDPHLATIHTTESDATRRAAIFGSLGAEEVSGPIWSDMLWRADPVLVVEDVAREPEDRRRVVAALGSGSLIGIRLEHSSVQTDGTPAALGALFVSFDEARGLSGQERLAAFSLAGLAALALANARLHADMLAALAAAEARAAVDPLTGLANHRTFQERLVAEVTRARRYGRALSLVILDLDHFKRVNDTFGHQAGDHALVEAAHRLGAIARGGDLVARVGGEEFAWIMPETEGIDAWQVAERARAAMAATRLTRVGRVTMSGGVCDLSLARDADELYRFADGALYWAKHQGRDVVFLYSPEVVEVLSAEEQAERLTRQQALQSIRVLARAVDAKDPSTRQHSERVADMAMALATALGWDAERRVLLREAGMVHDVGKIAVPDAILLKAGPLTAAEYAKVTEHAVIGADIVADVLAPEQVAWVRGHHERIDGTGYPDGLVGDEISDGARILALADAWDAMTGDRPYKGSMPGEEAIAECRRHAGRQFCPQSVDALVRLWSSGAVTPQGRLAGVA